MLAKHLNAVICDAGGLFVIGAQREDGGFQVAKVAFYLDIILLRARGDHEVRVMLHPVHLVDDDDAAAVLQVLQTARVGFAFDVGDVFVLAVLVHGFDGCLSFQVRAATSAQGLSAVSLRNSSRSGRFIVAPRQKSVSFFVSQGQARPVGLSGVSSMALALRCTSP